MSGGEKLVVVPARRASTRLPDKLLLAESGYPLLAHTLMQCQKSCAGRVVAAVDDQELAAAARSCGAEVVMTDSNLASGSDRVHAAVSELGFDGMVVNVQGDEPEIDPAAIDEVFAALAAGNQVATLATPLIDPGLLEDPAAVKVVIRQDGCALYFSRAPIPHFRTSDLAVPLLHIGVYGFQAATLEEFAASAPTPLELTEGLEQLRLLEMGHEIAVRQWPRAFPGIDTREDYDSFLARNKRQSPQT
ncbi:MAG: 3-deoxy-manno-octulosonate cytidylyltransferase [Planctomycetota bacterium]|nr:MAG: 3-deoxy-manno-octulosonate cytidylyltransferase [Planctomycetota bacterium]